MKKIKKIFDILWEIIIFYVFLTAMVISVVIIYIIPNFAIISFVVAIGMVSIIHFSEYLRERRK